MNRPIITGVGDSHPQEEKPTAAAEESLRPQQQDSPLAAQLPPWDLLPAHTLLVRRRPLKK